MDIFFFLNSMLLGVGLAMDAFTVSLANGLGEPEMRSRKVLGISGAFAFFQALMPMTGWLLVRTIVSYFTKLDRAVPWIALLLLAYIGGSMIYEGFKGGDGAGEGVRLTPMILLMQAVATSIDALSVGFTISDYGFIKALICSCIIAVVTFIISSVGLKIGRTVGTKISGKATVIGGIILIGIGIEIVVTNVFM